MSVENNDSEGFAADDVALSVEEAADSGRKSEE